MLTTRTVVFAWRLLCLGDSYKEVSIFEQLCSHREHGDLFTHDIKTAATLNEMHYKYWSFNSPSCVCYTCCYDDYICLVSGITNGANNGLMGLSLADVFSAMSPEVTSVAVFYGVALTLNIQYSIHCAAVSKRFNADPVQRWNDVWQFLRGRCLSLWTQLFFPIHLRLCLRLSLSVAASCFLSLLSSSASFLFHRKKEQATTKKDRVTHCLTICENIVAQSLR